MDYINIGLRSYTIILLISTLSFITGSNINCNGKAFHCVNSTHFKICVDLGGGVSTTVDEFLIPCPQNTVCQQYNLFECEYELTTTLPPATIQSEVTNEQFKTIDRSVREQLDITSLFPTKQQQGVELSEKYYNNINTRPTSFTESFLTDAVIDPVTSGVTNDLHTSSNSDINKTLIISRSTDKELISPLTESGIDGTQTSPFKDNTLVTDIGIRSKYNTETPVFFLTTQDIKTIDSFKRERSEPVYENSLDLDASFIVTKRTNQISGVAEGRYSEEKLPGNFTDPFLQENTPRKSNINHLIKSENTRRDNLDISNKYNTAQLNNSDNNSQNSNNNSSMYSTNTSTDVYTLNSTPFNVITDEIFTSDISDINKKSKVNSVIMLKSSGQHLAEITTASTIIVPGTTNQSSSHISLNTQVIETFFNDGLKISTNLEKLSVTNDDVMTSTTFIPESSVVKTNDMSSQMTKSGFNYGLSSLELTKPNVDEKNAVTSNKPQTSNTKSSKLRNGSEILNLKNEFEENFTTEANSVNISQYLTITEPYLHDRSDIPISSTSKSEVTSPITISEVSPLRSKEATQTHNESQINNLKTMESEIRSTKIQSNFTFLPHSNFSLFTTSSTKTATNDNIVVGDYSYINVDMLPVLTIAELSNGVTRLKPLSDLTTESEPWPDPVIVIGATDLYNNNITSTEKSNNITAEISNVATNLNSISDLVSKNDTWLKPAMVTDATDLDNNNITTTKESNNITAEISNGVTSFKSISDLISKNKTWPKPVMVTVATDFDNNITTTEASNNITSEIPNGVTRLNSISDLVSKNDTWLKPAMVTDATDLDNNNITTTKESNNITAEISNGVTSFKSISDLISKNKTWPKPVMVTVATDFDNNITTTEASNNITSEIPNGVTRLNSISDLISKNDTWPKPAMVAVATDLDNNNITTTKESNNITAEISNGVTSFKSISDLISKNKTWPKPVMVTVATDFDNNITTTEASNNITSEIPNGVTRLNSISDLISKNDTWPKPAMVAVATDLDNNNITTTKESNNITAEISNGVTSFKSISDLISKNKTWPKPVMVTVATDFDNNITTTEASNNITSEIPNGVTRLNSISDLISKNDTWPKPAMVAVATDLDNNNITTTKESNNITAEISNGVTSFKSISDLISKNKTWPKPVMVTVATDFDNNITTTEASNNITSEIPNGVTRLNSISDLISKNDTWPKPAMVAVATELDNNNIRTTEESNNITSELPNGVTRLNSISDLISKNDTWPKPAMVAVATELENNKITTTEESNNITAEISNGVTSLKSISDLISKNDTWPKPAMVTDASDLDNNITTTEESNNITSKTSNEVSSLKSISDLISKNDTWPKHKNVTRLSSHPAKNEMITKQVIYKNTSGNDKILGRNSFGNPNLTKLRSENILIPKLVPSNNFSLSPAINITNVNNNITDKNYNSLKDIEIKHNQVTNILVDKLLTVSVINTELNYTDKNVVSSVSSKSEKVPLINFYGSLTKSPLTDIYNVGQSYFSENISQTLRFNKTTASNKNHETEDKESGIAPAHAISIIKHEGNKTAYVLLNPYTQVNTTAIEINDTTLKDLSYNSSESSLSVRNNVKHDFVMKAITSTSAVKNTAPKYVYDTKGSSFNKSTMTIESVNTNNCTNCSFLADYFQLSEIPNRQLSGNAIKPLLIVQKTLKDLHNMTSLHSENRNHSLITGHGFQGYVSRRINKSKISVINDVNRSELVESAKNITSSNISSGDIINNWGVFNTTRGSKATEPTKIFTYINVSKVNILSVIRTKENYTNDLNATNKSSITANNFLRNTSSQTNTIQNKTQDGVSSNVLQFPRISSEFEKVSQSTGPLKMKTTPFISNKTKLDIISEQEKNTVSDHTNRSIEIEKKQLRNGHGYLESIPTIVNGVTKSIRNITQNSFTTPISNINYPDTHYANLPTNQEFRCIKRGKYSDTKDCNKFYVCIGRAKPIIGVCPTDTVFSEYLKQCTKNFTHCIRNNQFKCAAAGRFSNILCNNTYFICAKKNTSFIRFTFQCQKGYYLDKNNTKCIPELKNISKSDENSSKSTKELSFEKSKEIEGDSITTKNIFECEKEGKFQDPLDCRKYYVCKKGRKSIYRRKIKQCDSDEVFHGKKKKCVDVESYECDI